MYTYISMYPTVTYYNMFKKFIFQHLFGWVSCIKIDSNSTNKNGALIHHPNSTLIYDPEFSFLSPSEFPPKLPNNSTYYFH